jgi:predicted DNA-binding transcriptional regulator AlpA
MPRRLAYGEVLSFNGVALLYKDIAMQKLLPETGFLRLSQIIGKNGSPSIIPVSAATWWNGIRTGKYPKPVKLGERITAWRAEDIRALIEGV